MNFGEKLKALRNNKKMTQNKVAEEIGVSRRAYIAYEQGNSRPRNQETYDRLAQVLGCDVNYLRVEDTLVGTAALVAGVTALTAFLSPIGALTPTGTTEAMTAIMNMINTGKKRSSPKEQTEESPVYTNDILLQYEKHQKQFAAIALGIIYKAATDKGINCRHGNIKELDSLGSRPDDYMIVSDNNINSWWLIFWAKDKKLDERIIVFPEDRAGVLMSRFTTAPADPHRMASIVVDDVELYEATKKFKDHNSYRGNLSVILLDTDTVSVIKEEIISTYQENLDSDTYLTLL